MVNRPRFLRPMTDEVPRPTRDDLGAFAAYTRVVQALVRKELERAFASDRDALSSPLLLEIHDSVAEYVQRGGKRVRAVLCAATFEGLGGNKEDILGVLAALELLHAYLLVHDDWMDRDDQRRGGATLHVTWSRRLNDTHAGASAAVLAGDYLSATAQGLLLTARVEAIRIREACRVFSIMQRDVVWGQMLDTLGGSSTPQDVEAMHMLKTASYTAEGPLLVAATLAGAGPGAVHALRAVAKPLGIAFQLKDDLASAFLDAEVTGKARLGDLAERKCSSLVAEGMADPTFRAAWEAFVASPRSESTAARAEEIARQLEALGARARVEARLVELTSAAKSALALAPLSSPSKAVLGGFADSLSEGLS